MLSAQFSGAYKKWFLLGLLVQVIAAWFSVGYNHYDEHFQVLEFCNYKLGLSPLADLPWEYATYCRPAVQPFIAYGLCKVMMALSLYNPFGVAFLLRLMMGVFTWLITCRLISLLIPQYVTEKGRLVYVWCSFLLWFVAYAGVRFSAENIAALLFFYAIALLPGVLAQNEAKAHIRLLAAGLLFGVTAYVRLQMAFTFLALGLWLIVYAKWRLQDWLLLILGGLVAMGLCMLIDHWFYGVWVFAPYNYYKVNIIQHAAAKFGTSPWWQYFLLFFDMGVPPLSYVLFLLFLFGIWKNPRHPFSWICIAFIAGHCMIGHKEIRFLLPVTPAFIFLACMGFDSFLQQFPDKRFYRWALSALAVINTVVLCIKILMPAHESIGYYKTIYKCAQKQPTTLVCFEESPYHIAELEMNFYKPKNLEIVIIHTKEELTTILDHQKGNSVLFLNPKMDPIPLIANCNKELVYCLLPDWIHVFNYGDWIGRSYIWSLYRLK